MKQSSGTLLYRPAGKSWEVLIVHPSGNYNRKAPWSIPKGIPDEGESLEAAARRETREETGVEAGELVDLGSIEYTKSKKTVYCFTGPAPPDAEPRLVSWEVDRAEFVPVEQAKALLHPEQALFVERLLEMLAKR